MNSRDGIVAIEDENHELGTYTDFFWMCAKLLSTASCILISISSSPLHSQQWSSPDTILSTADFHASSILSCADWWRRVRDRYATSSLRVSSNVVRECQNSLKEVALHSLLLEESAQSPAPEYISHSLEFQKEGKLPMLEKQSFGLRLNWIPDCLSPMRVLYHSSRQKF